MFDIYFLATSILGGFIITLFANVASVRLPSVLTKLAEIRTSFVSALKAIFEPGTVDYSGKPLTRAQVTAAFSEGTWQRRAYEDYKAVLLDEDLVFPCVYATKGFKTDDQLYIFIDSDDLSNPCHIRSLATALSVYLPQAHDLGPNTSLVLLAKQMKEHKTVEEYNMLFWEMLNGLAKLDSKAWPASVPRDIDTDKWCFCFGGEPFFTVIQTPAHQVRRSRYAPGLTIVFQPKWIFDILFSTEAKRAGALSKVRALLAKYDPIPVSPELKNYGDPGSRESQQYFLLDENAPAPCPYDQLNPSGILKS
ncbi:YqcI/YcgG family-domain-containing protein [Phlebopus sp. FC_14]|nr:YqcI/YcgG family-domain-containing protein [Phlebopus sp. FC_14]